MIRARALSIGVAVGAYAVSFGAVSVATGLAVLQAQSLSAQRAVRAAPGDGPQPRRPTVPAVAGLAGHLLPESLPERPLVARAAGLLPIALLAAG